MCTREPLLVLVSLVIGWKSGARTLNQSLSEVMQNQGNSLITFDTQLKTALTANNIFRQRSRGRRRRPCLRPLLSPSRRNLYAIVFIFYISIFQKLSTHHILMSGTHDPEPTTLLCSCNGVFTDRFIFRLNFPRMRLPQEPDDQLQEIKLTS